MGEAVAPITPFAQRVAEIRHANRWTQAELAERSGLSRSTINRLEAGRRTPTTRMIVALRHPLGMSVEELVKLAFPPM